MRLKCYRLNNYEFFRHILVTPTTATSRLPMYHQTCITSHYSSEIYSVCIIQRNFVRSWPTQRTLSLSNPTLTLTCSTTFHTPSLNIHHTRHLHQHLYLPPCKQLTPTNTTTKYQHYPSQHYRLIPTPPNNYTLHHHLTTIHNNTMSQHQHLTKTSSHNITIQHHLTSEFHVPTPLPQNKTNSQHYYLTIPPLTIS